MQDEPTGLQILESTIQHLRNRALPGLEGRALFEMRVTISALELVRREFALGPSSDAAERARLHALLGEDGELYALNQKLCAAIASGEMGMQTPGLLDHLRQTSIEKLAVDQPNYAAYQAATKAK